MTLDAFTPASQARPVGGQVQSTDGYDLVFTSEVAGTNFEVESDNSVTGAIAAWVRAATIFLLTVVLTTNN